MQTQKEKEQVNINDMTHGEIGAELLWLRKRHNENISRIDDLKDLATIKTWVITLLSVALIIISYIGLA